MAKDIYEDQRLYAQIGAYCCTYTRDEDIPISGSHHSMVSQENFHCLDSGIETFVFMNHKNIRRLLRQIAKGSARSKLWKGLFFIPAIITSIPLARPTAWLRAELIYAILPRAELPSRKTLADAANFSCSRESTVVGVSLVVSYLLLLFVVFPKT